MEILLPLLTGLVVRKSWNMRTVMKLADKVAIITGAGRNIGEDTSKLFASEGATIAVADLDTKALKLRT